MSSEAKHKALRAAVEKRDAILVPGAANALAARVMESVGFAALYVTGAGVANTRFGVPDIGLVTMSEMAETVAEIADVTETPLIVDGDTGFGNALNMVRTVRAFERAGASAVQIEDQLFPKRCGHFAGKKVVPVEEMTAKVKAAVDSRHSADFLVIARTDARAIEGLEAAIDRAAAYVEAGADMTFVEAPTSAEELAAIARNLPVPQLANMVFGGKTPLLPRDQLAEMGFSVVLYANAALQASVLAMETVLGSLKTHGHIGEAAHLLASFEARQRSVDKDRWDALETRYGS